MAEAPADGLLLADLAYGAEYARIFLNASLPTLLDASNLPAIKSNAAFVLFTDAATRPTIEADARFQALQRLVPTTVYTLPALTDPYGQRYDMQAMTLGLSMARAYKDGLALVYLTADGCYGAGAIPAMLTKLREGYDSVCGQALRTAAEVTEPALSSGQHAPTASELFQMGIRGLSPLWVASHWDSPCFSTIPYALLWSDAEQLVMRMTSVSVHAIQPTKALLQAKGCPDMVLFQGSAKPYMAYDWAEFPVINVEPLRCFYPPFQVGLRASATGYCEWAKRSVSRDSLRNLTHAWTYQDPAKRPSAESTAALVDKSAAVVRGIWWEAGLTEEKAA